MTTGQRLLADQERRLQSLDPLLPPWVPPDDGELLHAAAGAEQVAGTLLRSHHPPGSLARMWSAAHVSELVPLLGAAGRTGMGALLAGWHARLPELGLPEDDSACVVTWPSRDAEASRALLDHGLVPLSVIAIRAPGGAPDEDGGPAARAVRVRQAQTDDLEDCLRLALAEQEYSALVGGAVPRPETPAVKRALLHSRLARDEPIWVAERDGAVVGLAECGYTDVGTGSWSSVRLRGGRWGYVNCASVQPDTRGHGVGQALLRRAHAVFAEAGVVGSYLYYNPPNPLSSVFWPRQGYRPLWTIWEARPASALR